MEGGQEGKEHCLLIVLFPLNPRAGIDARAKHLLVTQHWAVTCPFQCAVKASSFMMETHQDLGMTDVVS